MAETTARPGLYRLLAWASPSFPTGAFSYSHGLEAMVLDGTVRDRFTLQAWIGTVIAHGSGRIDADILRDAYRAVASGDVAMIDTVSRRGLAYRGTAELALESEQQGDAFVAAWGAAWRPSSPHPHPPPQAGEGISEQRSHPPPQAGEGVGGRGLTGHPPPLAGEGRVGAFSRESRGVCHSTAFGAAAAEAGIALEEALIAYLQAFAGNLVSAGIRLGVIGQTDGQRILAALEPVILEAAQAALSRDPRDFGSATFAVDLASMAHETQYSRLFRS